MSIGVSGVIYLIGHISNDADGFLQFRVLIRVLELISVPNHSRDSFILIEFNTLSSVRRLLVSIGVSGVIYLIGHILMMQMDSSISGFDSGSRAHFRSESPEIQF